MAYDPDNVFAKILRGELPCHKICEDASTFAFMDIMPRADGHCLVVPKEHFRNVFDIGDQSLCAVHKTARKVAIACKRAFNADGITIQQFSEPAGGQIVFHYHVHVIPRMEGVKLRPHTGEMADNTLLAEQCAAIKHFL